MKKIKFAPSFLVILLWATLTLSGWILPDRDISDAERRPLAKRPEITASSILSGKFMESFEDWSLDQFPLRDGFRTVKSLFHTYVLGQKDNNGIYISQGYAAKQEYPLDEGSVDHALDRFQKVYESYLEPHGSKVWMALVPDKGYYLAHQSGHLALDYGAMDAMLREGMPWAEHIDLTGTLELEDYYRTDTHWRQEALPETAAAVCEALGVTAFRPEELTLVPLERPFYGVYYGQAALPMGAETMYILKNDILSECTVYDHETGGYGQIYDLAAMEARDQYDVFLSGAKSLLTIENPAASTDRELIVFRDSFGSSMVPLLLKDYKTVTLVDIRYVQQGMLGRFLDFHGQDVLFLYSTLVLNNSSTIK